MLHLALTCWVHRMKKLRIWRSMHELLDSVIKGVALVKCVISLEFDHLSSGCWFITVLVHLLSIVKVLLSLAIVQVLSRVLRNCLAFRMLHDINIVIVVFNKHWRRWSALRVRQEVFRLREGFYLDQRLLLLKYLRLVFDFGIRLKSIL